MQVVRLLLSKKFTYMSDQKLIERQKQSTDKFGNNAMHKACRFRNADMIDLMLKNKIGKLDQRNKFGRLPLE